MAALAMVGMMMTGCSNDDNFAQEPQPEVTNKGMTMTTTISLDDGAATRALNPTTGVKTFAEGDQVAVIYYVGYIGHDDMWHVATHKSVSNALAAGDISNGGKTATITVTLDQHHGDSDEDCVYSDFRIIYPAAMAGDIGENTPHTDDYGTLNFAALLTQDGTPDWIASHDLATFDGQLNGTSFPDNITLENRLAVMAYTLKDADGTNDLTSTITGMVIKGGPNFITVTREAAEGPIYVAMIPVDGQDIEYIATGGTTNYTKSVSSKTYAAGNIYNLGLRMTAAPPLTVTSPAVGQVIGSDGKNNDYASLPDGVTTIAKIFYINGSNGLALALFDDKDGNSSVMDWSTAIRVCNAHTPIFSGGIWKLPNRGEWEAMFAASGSWEAVHDGFTSVGGMNLYNTYYWTSTPYGDIYAWNWNVGAFDKAELYQPLRVRACLAF